MVQKVRLTILLSFTDAKFVLLTKIKMYIYLYLIIISIIISYSLRNRQALFFQGLFFKLTPTLTFNLKEHQCKYCVCIYLFHVLQYIPNLVKQ